MSLDFYLMAAKESISRCECPTCGNEHLRHVQDQFYWRNITHNLGKMFDEAGVYDILWRGGGKRAGDVLPAMQAALEDMRARPEHYKQFDAPNGWGTYPDAVLFLEDVARACGDNPDAVVQCSV